MNKELQMEAYGWLCGVHGGVGGCTNFGSDAQYGGGARAEGGYDAHLQIGGINIIIFNSAVNAMLHESTNNNQQSVLPLNETSMLATGNNDNNSNINTDASNGSNNSEFTYGPNLGPINNLCNIKGLTLEIYRTAIKEIQNNGSIIRGGGVEFWISYISPVINSNAKWVQEIWTDDPSCGRTSPYFDDLDPNNNCEYMGSTAYPGTHGTNANNFKSFMADRPIRDFKDGNVSWEGVSVLWQDGKPLVSVIYGFNNYNGVPNCKPIWAYHF